MTPEETRADDAGDRKARRLIAALELAVATLGLVVLAGVLLGRLWRLPVGWGALLVAFGALLAVRVVGVGCRGGGASGLQPGSWLAGLGSPALVLTAPLLVVLALLPPPGTSLGADAGPHLAQLRDVLLGGDFASQLGLEPGATLLQAPFFLVGHGVAHGVAASGRDWPTDGTGDTYENALRLGAALCAFAAAIFAFHAGRRFFPPLFTAVCVAGVWLSSTLFHYSAAEPAMAHAPATAVSSLLVLLWLRARERPDRLGRWLAAAFVGGLLVAVQRYDVYLLLPVVLSGGAALRDRWRSGDGHERRRTLLGVAAVAGAFALALLPLLLQAVTPAGFLLDADVVRTTMVGDRSRPHIGATLFSSNGGLFAWTPIALLGVLGLVGFARRERDVALTLLATLALGVLVLASNATWWAGWSFGARRLTEAFPIIVLGFCAFAAAAVRRPRAMGLAALAGLVAVNVSLSDQVRRGTLPPEDGVSFARALQGVVGDVHAVVGHPPSWPANWLFAARYGLSPGRFDELYGRVPREQWVVRLGTPGDLAVLGRGWSGPYGDPPAPLRWAMEADATLLPTLVAPTDRRLTLRAIAAPHPGDRPQGLLVEVNGRPAGRLLLRTRVQSIGLSLPRELWTRGLNELRFRPEWRLSRRDAWELGMPAYASWGLEEMRLEPVDP